MPQITVTIDDETYMNLTHFLPKGMKSRFVNMAVAVAITDCSINAGNIYNIPTQVVGNAMHRYAKDGPDAAVDYVMKEMRRLDDRQQSITDYNKKFGVDEE